MEYTPPEGMIVLTPNLPPVTLVASVGKNADVIVVGMAAASGRDVLVGVPNDLGKALAKMYGEDATAVAVRLGASSKPGTVVAMPGPGGRRMVVVGLGDIDVSPEQVRRAIGNALRAVIALPSSASATVAISVDAAGPAVIEGIVEGALLGAYEFRAEPDAGPRAIQVVSSSRKPDALRAVQAAVATATAVCQARDWVNQAPNLLYPEVFADQVRDLGKRCHLGVEVWDEKALARDGFGGILAVGGGSAHQPRLVKLTYAPRGASAHLVLVGKGVTFDAGGLNTKPLASMITMKTDMAGAASVVAATAAIASLGLKIRVTAYAPMAENLPSGSAYRPSDVLTMYGGKTVENANPDAEGRLLLADALTRACEESPSLAVDVATLTGACRVALGERVAGLMSRDDETADLLLDAAETAGELFWQLPIPAEALGKLASDVADLKSSGDRMGGALTAAAFLGEFVPPATRWAHLDIAGTAFNPHPAYDYVPAGATGMSVRTLVALARAMAS